MVWPVELRYPSPVDLCSFSKVGYVSSIKGKPTKRNEWPKGQSKNWTAEDGISWIFPTTNLGISWVFHGFPPKPFRVKRGTANMKRQTSKLQSIWSPPRPLVIYRRLPCEIAELFKWLVLNHPFEEKNINIYTSNGEIFSKLRGEHLQRKCSTTSFHNCSLSSVEREWWFCSHLARSF